MTWILVIVMWSRSVTIVPLPYSTADKCLHAADRLIEFSAKLRKTGPDVEAFCIPGPP